MSCVDCHNPHGSVLPRIDPDDARQRTGLLQVPWRQARAPSLSNMLRCGWRAAAPAISRTARPIPRMLTRHEVRFVCMECHSNLPVPTPPANAHAGNGGPGITRSAQPALPELHHLPPEGAWFLREPGLVQMRFLLAFLISIAAFAQQPAPPAKPRRQTAAQAPAKADEQAKPAETAAAPAKADEKAASPAPSTEQWFTGSFDFGYRWVDDVRGSFPTYRSVVNLGEGPKLTGLDFTITDPKNRLFDRIDARANAWGGDPYNTAHVKSRKRGIYDLTVDYRNIAYFNARAFVRQSACAPAASTSGLSIPAGAPAWSNCNSSPASTSCRTWSSNATPATATASRPGCRTPTTNSPSRTCCATAPTTIAAACASNINRLHVTLEQGGTTYQGRRPGQLQRRQLRRPHHAGLGSTSVLNSLRRPTASAAAACTPGSW